MYQYGENLRNSQDDMIKFRQAMKEKGVPLLDRTKEVLHPEVAARVYTIFGEICH